MANIQVSEKNVNKGGEKLKNKRLLKSSKGFSLVELLIVIAIMGVLAVIAFNMFGGVLENSKKRADDQMALEVQNKVLSYCMETNDWSLTKAETALTGGTAVDLDGNSKDLIIALMEPVFVEGKEYGPYFNLKDPDASDEVNHNAYDPQWNGDNGGDYAGWAIEIWPANQTVTCKPVKTAGEAVVHVN